MNGIRVGERDNAQVFGRVLMWALILGAAAGAVVGVVRGISNPTTVWAAAVEGAVLIGVPAGVIGLVVGGIAVTVRSVRR